MLSLRLADRTRELEPVAHGGDFAERHPRLHHAEWPRVHAEQDDPFGPGAESPQIVLVWRPGISQRVIDVPDGGCELQPGSFPAQAPGGCDERLGCDRSCLLFGHEQENMGRKIVARFVILNQTVVMPKLIPAPTRIAAAGTKPKTIDEFVGRVNSGDEQVSIAHMRSPCGWVEPGQTPEFDEYTVVLHGQLRVTHRGGALDVCSGQGVVVRAGEWVQVQQPRERRSGVYRGLPACLFAAIGSSGCLRGRRRRKAEGRRQKGESARKSGQGGGKRMEWTLGKARSLCGVAKSSLSNSRTGLLGPR